MEALLTPQFIFLFITIISLASIAGFLAGLLGIGGGLILVPGLYYIFDTLGYNEAYLMHIAIGTSLATIMATGLSSARSHHKRGAVDFNLMKLIAPGLLIGVIVGSLVASSVESFWLKCFFVPALLVLAILMGINPTKLSYKKGMPSWHITTVITSFVGTVSSLMGIGGAALNVPFMSLCNIPIHKAIGTASALGILIAISGSIGFFLIGLEGFDNAPPFTFGYINVLALVFIMPITIFMAPIGVSVAHRVSVSRLRKIFSIFLLLLAIRMAADIFTNS